ncbi:MAG: glutaredoxin domain-containing protein [Pseudomonadota bacterium]
MKFNRAAFQDIPVDGDAALRRLIAERSGRSTVPQIWIGEHHVGGYTDLLELERSGRLDELLLGTAAAGPVPG